MNISIKDYKEYSEKYSSIEIELKFTSDKRGQIVDIDKENEIYYHIYLSDNKEEIKRNYSNKNGEKYKIIINY